MKRIPELDSVRGLAAIVIVAYHLWFLKYGFLGTAVDLFFVMSGYLITTIILKGMNSPGFFATFYSRRALRIWPIYYLSLLGIVVLSRFLPSPLELNGLPYFLTYTQNIEHYWFSTEAPFTRAFSHTWTLAIEEQFYMIWPVILVICGRRGLVPAASTLIGISVVARFAGFSPWILLTRFDGLAFGSLLAAVISRVEGRVATRRSLTIVFLVIGLLSLAYMAGDTGLLRFLGSHWAPLSSRLTRQSLRILAVNVMYFGVVGLLVLHAGHRWFAPLRDTRLAYLGQISYGIYLYHLIIFILLDQYGTWLKLPGGLGLDLIKLSLTIVMAMLSWTLIERPLLGLKNRFHYRATSDRPALEKFAGEPRLETAGQGA